MSKILQFPGGEPASGDDGVSADELDLSAEELERVSAGLSEGELVEQPAEQSVDASADSAAEDVAQALERADFGDLDDVITIDPELTIAGQEPSAEVPFRQEAAPAEEAAPHDEERVLPPPKFGFTRVRRSRKKDKAKEHQLDLFPVGKVLAFPAPALEPFEEGLLRDEEGHVDVARDLYETAIAAGDRVADACCNLGIIDYQSGNVEEAFDCFRTALKHDPRHWESHYNLANLYFDSGQYDPAHVHYGVAAEISPESRNIFFNLGLALALQGDYDAAIDALSSYRHLAPGEEGEAAEDLLAALRKTRQAAGPSDE
ncbi:MAG: tetratricopeptide repeat protein [Gemmatimonadetes bacterium]|jgi:tetratricopeptide (TPR) repeat protein|nr:tetratricopeptide repeat protein [Gemmatimonadota bacterium]MBT5054925.1 tetratricopeptide repeat protein [Gemmatimonadota bacterium]MBT5145846.1 tetratricopeptide repeat protein [Gemmatimonadota bacterium]MBT5587827.1 tetratricopeptide repeat protein [Gemmatimonadota bacterium]MBT5962999.1 tetratricopeptide repeat protein [Gemmatimonadota bacterium]